MKKRLYSKKNKLQKRVKRGLFLLIFVLSIYITYQYLEESKNKISQKEFVEIALSQNEESTLLKKIVSTFLPSKEKTIRTMLEENYQGLIKEEEKEEHKVEKRKSKEKQNPTIYIYNTHQTEEYTPSSFVEYSIMPTVQMNNYILEEKFEENNYTTIVEEKNIKEVLNKNGWNYAGSYQASRIFLETAKKNYPTLKYFIDVHRDSLGKDKTTITIDKKSYAKILFIVGLENPNYSKNLEFTEKINQKLNEKYPGLSKGIYKKEGEGVNGVYNQDFSPFTILVEMGGPENTIDEILNTSLAFSECFIEVINQYEL